MSNTVRRSICLLLIFLMGLQLHPCARIRAAEEAYVGEAYYDLPTEQMRTAYRILEEGIASLAPIITFQGSVEIYSQELSDVILAVCVDHPEYFWFLEGGTFFYTGASNTSSVNYFEPDYILNGKTVSAGSQELADAMLEFHTTVTQIIQGIPVNCDTEYEIALYLHDYLAQHVTYTLEGEHPSAYAALVLGEAACYGYSKAYQCLLSAAGIRARTVTGEGADGNGNWIGHAWNLVWLDGNCYYVDVTWDDLETQTLHYAFAVSLNVISKDHQVDAEFALPECSHEYLNHFSLSQGPGTALAGNTTTAEQIAPFFRFQQITEEGAEFVCEIHFPNGNFWGWFDRIALSLLKELGLSGNTEVYYYEHYNVHYLILVDPDYAQVEPTVQAITLDTEQIDLIGIGSRYQLDAQVAADSVWTPRLAYSSSDESVAIVDENGMITAVGAGTAVITAQSALGEAPASCTVTVQDSPAHSHTMRYFGEAASSCTQEGHCAYYLCTSCGCRFADADGTVMYTQTAEYVIPSSHNRLLYVSKDGSHYQRCKCGADLLDTKEPHKDEDGDGNCDICKFSIAKANSGSNKEKDKNKNSNGWLIPVVVIAVIGGGVALYFAIRKRRWGY